MIVSLLVAVEKSQPSMSRLINVDDSMKLGELSQVIDAAFGFSGAASHLWMGPERDDGTRLVYSPLPTGGEQGELTVKVSQIREMTYVYDPAANWNIHVRVLGRSHLEGPTPVLIDALGPDVVEACNGPAMMTRFHTEARRITAGLDPDMEVAPLLLSFLPVMSPERLLQRLTQADQVTVSERISFVAEDLFVRGAEVADDDPRTPEFTAEFEVFLDSRPNLRSILSLDPNPERNPALISAMTEFFESVMPATRPPGVDDVEMLLGYFLQQALLEPDWRIKLTRTGALPPEFVHRLALAMGLEPETPNPRESTIWQVADTRRALVGAKMLSVRGNWLSLTKFGKEFLDGPTFTRKYMKALSRGFRSVYGEEWDKAVLWFAARYMAKEWGDTKPEPPEDPDKFHDLLCALLVVDSGEITELGIDFLSWMARLSSQN